MTNILVTGANGFIGQHLCSGLLKAGFRVRAAVRHFSESDLKHENIKYVIAPELGPETDWRPVLEGISQVVHLAGRAHVPSTKDEETRTLYQLVNAEGSARLARDSASAGVKRFIYLSSIMAVGEGGEKSGDRGQCVMDDDTPPNPQDFYGESKLAAEKLLSEIGKNTGLETVVLRPTLVYGPGVKANFLQLLEVVDSRLPLPLGLAKNGKSLVFIGNLTSAIITCLSHGNAPGKTYMVSDNETLSIRDLIRRLGKALGKRKFLLPVPITLMKIAAALIGKKSQVEKLTDPLLISSDKIRRELSWHPPYSVDEGLQEMADWYRSRT